MTKIINALIIVATMLCIAPTGALAQQDRYSPPYEPEPPRDRPRGEIQVTNDWRDEINVTIWTHQRERIGDSWTLRPGETAVLAVDGIRIKVRPNYKIKVGDDWGRVNLGAVGEFSRGTWYVNVRDIWRATHQRGGRGDRPGPRDENVPDWQR
ncbi:MAG: hypothetical protein HC889_07630 [Synechococcaceae cyanobacterium SM1_2_3]|nr:hypothetical protein [Synechococcaceae cyanobacterium SM1_2_3]